jgi:hypothetical protein
MEELTYRDRDSGLSLRRGGQEYPARTTVMLELPDARDVQPYVSNRLPTPDESVVFERYEPQYVRLRATLQSPGFVVLADTFYDGWSATVDGKPAPVWRANRAMRAVPVLAGEHVLEMRYRSIPFEVGAAISGLAWLGLLCAAIAAIAKSRQHAAAAPAGTRPPC